MEQEPIARLFVVFLLACALVGYAVWKKYAAGKKPKSIAEAMDPDSDEHDREIDEKADQINKEEDAKERGEKMKKLAKASRDFPRKKR